MMPLLADLQCLLS